MNRRLFGALVLGGLLTLGAGPGPALAEGVPREDCFPIERLDPKLRARAEELLLKTLDSEALYTVVGGLKPVSSSFWMTRFSVDGPDLTRLDETRQILSAFRCGDAFEAEVLVFAAVTDSKRHAHAWIAHRPALRRAIEAHSSFFAPYGVSPSTRPAMVVEKMEHAPPPDRLRASGHLFGYPDHAVDFFVKADRERAGSESKKLVPRDFLSIPTFAAETHKFVWAVPKGHKPNDADRALMDRAAPILAEYRRRRDLYVGPGKPGVVALLRDWFDDGYGHCAPENARFGTEARVPVLAAAATVPSPVSMAPPVAPVVYAAPAAAWVQAPAQWAPRTRQPWLSSFLHRCGRPGAWPLPRERDPC